MNDLFNEINDQCWTSIEDLENFKPTLPSTDGFFRSGKTGSLHVLRYIFEGLSVCCIISIAAAIPADSQEGKAATHESIMKPQRDQKKGTA